VSCGTKKSEFSVKIYISNQQKRSIIIKNKAIAMLTNIIEKIY
jgi:hypothetical protein